MWSVEEVDRLCCSLAGWDRDTLVREMLAYRSRFPVDWTEPFLRAQTAERLRHLFFALCLQNRRPPDGPTRLTAVAPRPAPPRAA